MRLERSDGLKLIIVAILLVLAITFMVLTNKFNDSFSPIGPTAQASESHGEEEASQLTISGVEGLQKQGLNNTVMRAVTRQLYAKHYKKDGKLEREAELVDTKHKGKTTTITVNFIPSGDKLTATITLNNSATNDFDIQIGESK